MSRTGGCCARGSGGRSCRRRADDALRVIVVRIDTCRADRACFCHVRISSRHGRGQFGRTACVTSPRESSALPSKCVRARRRRWNALAVVIVTVLACPAQRAARWPSVADACADLEHALGKRINTAKWAYHHTVHSWLPVQSMEEVKRLLVWRACVQIFVPPSEDFELDSLLLLLVEVALVSLSCRSFSETAPWPLVSGCGLGSVRWRRHGCR